MKLSLSGPQALGNTKTNVARTWLSGKDFPPARDRVSSDSFFRISHTPKFQLGPDDGIFTMGSCFAREIENTLIAKNMNVLLKGHGIAAEDFETWDEKKGTGGGAKAGSKSRGALIKYTVHAMADEIKRVLNGVEYHNEGLIELGPDRWFDPSSAGVRPLPFDRAYANRRLLSEASLEIKNANIVFLTLGLIEGWRDTETGIILNRLPPMADFMRNSKRFEFVDYGYELILAELKSLISIVREKCNPEMKFVVTVSPVPLGATFKSQDIVVANQASKATLRAAAEAVYYEFDFVDYFPSYEIVTNSPRPIAWLEDQIHVAPKMVAHIMDTFSGLYLK